MRTRMHGNVHCVMWQMVIWLAALSLLALGMQASIFHEESLTRHPANQKLPAHAFVIALERAKGELIASHVRQHLGLETVTIVLANNGSNATGLPLYTRHLIEIGRHDHMQIGNRPMVGCLLSHADVWAQVKEWSYVFEEDVVLTEHARSLVAWLLTDVMDRPWSILMLQGRSMISERASENVGKLASTCDNCTWFGTRGYIVTERGAKVLLGYVHPIIVQVDALIGLVNRFNPDFNLYWTRREIAGIYSILHTDVWDGCLRCYVGTPVGWWVFGIVAFCGMTCCLGRQMVKV